MTSKKIISNILDKPSQTIGNSIDGVLKYVFTPLLKGQIKKDCEFELYKEKIHSDISVIPAENLVAPALNIVGPAIEASKFYIDDGEIRNMFSKLISSSMDDRINEFTHPSFIEIIKQLSPLDAQIITRFKENSVLPIIKLRLILNDNSGSDFKVHILDNDVEKTDLISSSVSNLIRLGIVDVSYDSCLTSKSVYEVFENNPIYLDRMSRHKALISSGILEANNAITDILMIENREPKIVKGIISLTPFGSNFIKVCL